MQRQERIKGQIKISLFSLAKGFNSESHHNVTNKDITFFFFFLGLKK